MIQPLAQLAEGVPHGGYDSTDQSRGPFAIGARGQYFSQKSGSRLGNGAIVTKLFVLGAGFFQAVPLG
jgi:hypothetical protein